MTDTVAQTRAAINGFYRIDEERYVTQLLDRFPFTDAQEKSISDRAVTWIENLRRQPEERTLLEDFMQRYSLSTTEGLSLMSIAEAFLRIPDTETADRLIVDKITAAHWDQEDDLESAKVITRLSGWGLHFSESVLKNDKTAMGRLTRRLGLPVIRQAMAQAIKLLGGQFVCGRTISEALKHAQEWKADHTKTLFSYDMLGEGARTMDTADAYFKHYREAIEAVGKQNSHSGNLFSSDGISVKLSALHPRYEEFQSDYCLPVLIKRVKELSLLAKKYNILLTLDAEEAERLELSLDIVQAVLSDPDLDGYDGLGLAVQAYQKRAIAVIDYIIAVAHETGKRIPVRLVKGAYWDGEIKKAQERGLSGYPVFTRKASTDISYLVIADKMLEAHTHLYPAFATHNAHTISAILDLAERHQCSNYEFQRLHGMGAQLYKAAYDTVSNMPVCRVYAPVGAHRDLLPYLVRRLLENGANSSFVNQLYDEDIRTSVLVESPVHKLRDVKQKAHPHIPLPSAIYGDRLNSIAPDLSDRSDYMALFHAVNLCDSIQKPKDTDENDLEGIFQKAQKGFVKWNKVPVSQRADILDRIASLYEEHKDDLISICVLEGKKTMADVVSEWREAIDFCRYYAQQMRTHFDKPTLLPGPTGERNTLQSEGCGIFVCISPWNFPLAIFTGQIVAALVAGNAVIAKPAEQTTAIAVAAVSLMHKAGVPEDVLHLIIGSGRIIGAKAVEHPLTAGVAFTGSTKTAWHINQALAARKTMIAPLIAETGGQNAMIVDSTALAEQVVDDVIRSAFLSAGQRCSALRVLYVQKDIHASIIKMLTGAMKELRIGNPALKETDIGPVIDEGAQQSLLAHIRDLSDRTVTYIKEVPLYDTFVAPHVFSIQNIADIDKENFGPLLHVIPYDPENLDTIIADINAVGYGLTLGIHSRVEAFIERIINAVRVGNIYVNRTMTGAVVGVQPFGGMGLSGTGPKAGGPHYLTRFITEKAISVNTTASGGNTSLTTLKEDV